MRILIFTFEGRAWLTRSIEFEAIINLGLKPLVSEKDNNVLH
jgi:hypothetical protein